MREFLIVTSMISVAIWLFIGFIMLMVALENGEDGLDSLIYSIIWPLIFVKRLIKLSWYELTNWKD